MANRISSSALILLLVALPRLAAADDPAIEQDSVFIRRAAAITEMNVAEQEKQAALRKKDAQEKTAAAEKGKPAQSSVKGSQRVRLHEIGGSNGQMTAIFRLSNGTLKDFVPGQTVPGFGKITAIEDRAVQDASGHWQTVDDDNGGTAP